MLSAPLLRGRANSPAVEVDPDHAVRHVLSIRRTHRVLLLARLLLANSLLTWRLLAKSLLAKSLLTRSLLTKSLLTKSLLTKSLLTKSLLNSSLLNRGEKPKIRLLLGHKCLWRDALLEGLGELMM